MGQGRWTSDMLSANHHCHCCTTRWLFMHHPVIILTGEFLSRVTNIGAYLPLSLSPVTKKSSKKSKIFLQRRWSGSAVTVARRPTINRRRAAGPPPLARQRYLKHELQTDELKALQTLSTVPWVNNSSWGDHCGRIFSCKEMFTSNFGQNMSANFSSP